MATASDSNSGLTKIYRLEDEIANAITHGIGLVLSIAGLCVLVTLAALKGSVAHLVGCSIYGASLVILYSASTIYHCARTPRARAILRVVDHVCIFLLIA